MRSCRSWRGAVDRQDISRLALQPTLLSSHAYAHLRSKSTSATDPESTLLGLATTGPAYERRSISGAPIITGDALKVLGSCEFPQRALLGRVLSQHSPGFLENVESPKLYLNTNAPFSGVVCGVQGSGKSHTTSVLLESCLTRDNRLGTLPAPLSGVLFYFDPAAGSGQAKPAEAAYLSALDHVRGGTAKAPKVVVLALPSNVDSLKRVYAGLANVQVHPLRFAATDISGERFLAMMKVETGNGMPLYMEVLMNTLRSMHVFDYANFCAKMADHKFNTDQASMLKLRMSLLDSCLEGGTPVNRVGAHFKSGQLTIIDLSSPFMDSSTACGLFNVVLGLYMEAPIKAPGKIIVLDEAHKYLSRTGSTSPLTDSIVNVIRQQRHLGARVIISTQEPTVVPPSVLDLCSFVIAHRFSSPKWLDHLSCHVSVPNDLARDYLQKILRLQTGQALLFAPAGIGCRQPPSAKPGLGVKCAVPGVHNVAPFGQGFLHIHSRERITLDGGQSVLAVAVLAAAGSVASTPGTPSASAASGTPADSVSAKSPRPNEAKKIPSPAPVHPKLAKSASVIPLSGARAKFSSSKSSQQAGGQRPQESTSVSPVSVTANSAPRKPGRSAPPSTRSEGAKSVIPTRVQSEPAPAKLNVADARKVIPGMSTSPPSTRGDSSLTRVSTEARSTAASKVSLKKRYASLRKLLYECAERGEPLVTLDAIGVDRSKRPEEYPTGRIKAMVQDAEKGGLVRISEVEGRTRVELTAPPKSPKSL